MTADPWAWTRCAVTLVAVVVAVAALCIAAGFALAEAVAWILQ